MRPYLCLAFGAFTLAAFETTTSSAADISWTNTAGGNWSRIANWEPNVAPGPADSVFITVPGSYTVTQDVSVAVTALTLGDGSSSPMLTNEGHTLSLSGASLVRAQAVFALGAGSLSGSGSLIIDGFGLWVGGQLARTTDLIIGTNGVLEITGADAKVFHGFLTNAGLVRMAGAGALGFCGATLVNLGLFELENDQSLYLSSYCGASLFLNAGVLRKSAGTGTNLFAGIPVISTGPLEVESGCISYNGNSVFMTGTIFAGPGTNLLDRDNVRFEGTILCTNAQLSGANLRGTNEVHGTMRWTSGRIDRYARVTMAPDGLLEITGPAVKVIAGTFVNQGLVRLTGAAALGCCAGTIRNEGIFALENDQPIYLAAYCGPSLFENIGLLRKSAGSSTNLFASVPVVNVGTIETERGWISFSGGSWFGTGTRFLGAGTNLLDQDRITFEGAIDSGNAELAGATLFGTNTISGAMRWTSGGIDHSAKVTIAPEGQLEITGNSLKTLAGTLTNLGFVRQTGAASLSFCAGTLENLGVFELQNDQPIWLGAYCGPSVLRNTGVLRKSAGAGTNLFWAVPIANTGTIEAQQGWINFSGGSWFGAGTHFTGAGTNLLGQDNITFSGVIESSNAELAGATLFGASAISGAMRWTGGGIDHSAALTVASNGQLEITGSAAKILAGTITNLGFVRQTGGAALSLCAGTIVNLGLFELQNNQPIYLGPYCGPSLLRNVGVLRKTDGGGTNVFASVPIANTGTLEAQQGWISFSGGSWFGTGTRFVGAGTNLLDQGTVTLDGTIVSTNAELAGANLLGTNTIVGEMLWSGGGIDHSAKVTIDEGSQFEIAGAAPKVLAGTLLNLGSVRQTGDAALSLCAGAIDNLGTFDLLNDQPIYLGAYCGPSTLRNTGLLRKISGSGTNLFAGVSVANTGTVELRSGTVAFNAGFTQTAGRTHLAGGNASSAISFLFKGGIVCGPGDIFGDVRNECELNPGNGPGTVKIHGNFTHRGGGNVELGGLVPGTLHDRVEVTGATLLEGNLNVSLLPGYRPSEGDAFQVLSFASRSGSGLRFNGLDLGGGQYLTPVYSPTNLTLVTTNGPIHMYELLLVPGPEKTYELRFTCPPNEYYSLEASGYLTNDWVVLCTSNSPAGVLDYMDADAPNYPQRFYRARSHD